LEVLLRKVDNIIHSVAIKYLGSIDGIEYEDLMQIGRIKAWQIIEDKDINEDNIRLFVGYIRKAVQNDFLTALSMANRKKRINLSKTLSLDGVISENSDKTFHEIVPSKAGEITLETLEYIKTQALKTRNPKAVKGVILCLTEIMEISPKRAAKVINYKTFVSNGLARFLWVFFNNSPYRALRYAYPELSPEDMKKVPNNYWSGRRGKNRALKYFRNILENSGYEQERYPLIVNEKFIESVGLSRPYQIHFKSSPFLLIDAVYPGKYKPWEMQITSKGFLKRDDKLVKEMIRWLVEEKLNIALSDMDQKEVWHSRVSKKLTKEVMEGYGLRGLLAIYGNSPDKLVRIAYPDKFMPWDFPSNNKWKGPEGLELAAQATKWVIEDFAGLHPNSAIIGYRFFVENGLHGMITCRSLGFNSSPKVALKNAYPYLDFD